MLEQPKEGGLDVIVKARVGGKDVIYHPADEVQNGILVVSWGECGLMNKLQVT